MKARRILTTLAVGLGLVVALLWLLGGETPDIAQARGPNDQDTQSVIVSQGQIQDLWNPIAENSIIITDSTREGWESVVPYNSDTLGDGDILDWLTITMAHDGNELYVRYEVDGPPFNPDGFRYNVFVDVDRDRNTGFIAVGGWLSIGADILVQGGYRDGAVVIVWRFTGASQEEWSWSEIDYYPANEEELSGTKRDIEWKILSSDLDVFGNRVTSFDWVAFADNKYNNPSGIDDFYPDGGNNGKTGDFNTYTFVVPNPERGFYHFTETHCNNYTPLPLPLLQGYRENEGITLINRMFYLDDFVNSEISETCLISMTEDFNTVREAGLKMIVRFAYTVRTEPPIGDATKEWIITHTKQLSPVLRANSDVIAAMQAGFIGAWGEWWYSDHFTPDGDWDDRCEVLSATLGMLPITRMVQLRTPRYKMACFDTTCPVYPSIAHSGTPLARTGHHNDCFLSSASDYGTYCCPLIEYIYLIKDTKYVVMGGETCDPSLAADPDPDRLNCYTATKELEQFHWSYLNIDWYTPTLQSWRDSGCFPEIEQRLGYRFKLLPSTYIASVEPGYVYSFSVQIKNEGFAAPFNPRAVELILRRTDGLTYTFELPADPRFWLPGEVYTISHSINIPMGLPTGCFELLLSLPDPEPGLRHRPEYVIRLAGSTWEASTGYNNLNHKVCHIYLPIILKRAE